MLNTKLNQDLPGRRRISSRIVSYVGVLINIKCPTFGPKCKSCHSMNHFAKCCPKAKKVQQIECESSTESLVSSDDDFYVGLITADQPKNNESDYDLHSLIDSDDESDEENDGFDDQPDVDFVHSNSDVSNFVQE